MRQSRQPSLRPTPRATTAEVKAGYFVRHHYAPTTLEPVFGPRTADADVWRTLLNAIDRNHGAPAPPSAARSSCLLAASHGILEVPAEAEQNLRHIVK